MNDTETATATSNTLTNAFLYGSTKEIKVPDYTPSPPPPAPIMESSPRITPIVEIEAAFMGRRRNRDSNRVLPVSEETKHQQEQQYRDADEDEENNCEKLRRANALLEAHKSAWKKVSHHQHHPHYADEKKIGEHQSLETIATSTTTIDQEAVLDVRRRRSLETITTATTATVDHEAVIEVGQRPFVWRGGDGENVFESVEDSFGGSLENGNDDDDDDDVNKLLLDVVDDGNIGIGLGLGLEQEPAEWEREQAKWERKEALLKKDLTTWEQDQEPGELPYGIAQTRTTDWGKYRAEGNNEKTAEWEKEKDDWRKALLQVQVSFVREKEKAESDKRNADLEAWKMEKIVWEREKASWKREKASLEDKKTELEEEKACLEEKKLELEEEKVWLEEEKAELKERLQVSIQTVTQELSFSTQEIVRTPKALHLNILPTMVWPIMPVSVVRMYQTITRVQTSLNVWWVNETLETSRAIRHTIWKTTKAAAAHAFRIQMGLVRLKQRTIAVR